MDRFSLLLERLILGAIYLMNDVTAIEKCILYWCAASEYRYKCDLVILYKSPILHQLMPDFFVCI